MRSEAARLANSETNRCAGEEARLPAPLRRGGRAAIGRERPSYHCMNPGLVDIDRPSTLPFVVAPEGKHRLALDDAIGLQQVIGDH
jgi:hypothetical protein